MVKISWNDRTFSCDCGFVLDIENFPNKSDRFLVRVSFLEIYNEKISDLMVSSRHASAYIYFNTSTILENGSHYKAS